MAACEALRNREASLLLCLGHEIDQLHRPGCAFSGRKWRLATLLQNKKVPNSCFLEWNGILRRFCKRAWRGRTVLQKGVASCDGFADAWPSFGAQNRRRTPWKESFPEIGCAPICKPVILCHFGSLFGRKDFFGLQNRPACHPLCLQVGEGPFGLQTRRRVPFQHHFRNPYAPDSYLPLLSMTLWPRCGKIPSEKKK